MDEMKIYNKCEKISQKTDFYKDKNNKNEYLNEYKKFKLLYY